MVEQALLIRRLNKNDKRDQFESGNIHLDRFFRLYAGQNQFKHYIGITYVAELNGEIVGFVSVSGGEILSDDLSKTQKQRLPNYPLPILRIARLAVSIKYQNLGIGKQLLKSMFKLAIELKNTSGCVGITVDGKEEAISFYEKLGFELMEVTNGELPEFPVPASMFLPLKLIEEAS